MSAIRRPADEMLSANKSATEVTAAAAASVTMPTPTSTSMKPKDTNVTTNPIVFDDNEEEDTSGGSDNIGHRGVDEGVSNVVVASKKINGTNSQTRATSSQAAATTTTRRRISSNATTSTTKTPRNLVELNEPQENVHSPVVVAPQEDDNETGTTEISDLAGPANSTTEPLDDLFEFTTDNNTDNNQDTNSALLQDENETATELNDELSRRELLGRHKFGSHSIAEEIKKLKNQRTKLFGVKNPLKRKRSKKKKKLKSTQTRQGSTTVSYGSLGTHYVSPLVSNPLSSTLRQHFPALTNPQQLSSTVQKLIMNKLNPQIASISGGRQPSSYKYQQQLYPLQTSAESPVQSSQLSNKYTSSNSNSNNPRLADLLNQWASSKESLGHQSQRAAQSIGRPQSMGLAPQAGSKMIPIEIIGLDPAVTNSILYGANEGALNGGVGGEASVAAGQEADSSQMYSAAGEEDEAQPGAIYAQGAALTAGSAPSGQASLQASRGLRAVAKVLEQQQQQQRPKASSIVHIHHFHTRAKPPNNILAQQQQEASTGGGAGGDPELQQEAPPISATGPGGAVQSANESLMQMMQAQLGARPNYAQAAKQQAASGGQQQQVYVNERGQLVYLSVEDQNSQNSAAADGGRPGASDQEAQGEPKPDGSDTGAGAGAGQDTWTSVEAATNNQASEQQDVPAQQEYSTANSGGAIEAAPGDQQQQSMGSSGDASQEQQQQQQPVVESINLQQEQATIQTPLNSSQMSANFNQNYGGTTVNAQPGIFMVPVQRGQRHHMLRQQPQQQLQTTFMANSQGGDLKQQKIYLTSGGQISVIGQASPHQLSIEPESGGDNKQPMLMVAYKPKHQLAQQQLFRNHTQDQDSPVGAHRSPYNEGQESKPPLVSAAHYIAAGPQLFKGAGGHLLRPIVGTFGIQRPQSSLVAQPQQVQAQHHQQSGRFQPPATFANDFMPNELNLARFRPQFNLSSLAHLASFTGAEPGGIRIANLSSPILQLPSKYQLPENRVPTTHTLTQSIVNNPTLKALFAQESFNNGTTSNSNHNITGIPNSWLTPLIGDEKLLLPQMNGYGSYNNSNNKFSSLLFPLANGSSLNFEPLTRQQQNLIEDSLIFKHLQQQVRDKLQLQQQGISSMPPPSAPLRAPGSSPEQLFSSNNSTKFTNDELLTLLHDLKLTNTSLATINPFNISFSDSSIAVPSIAGRQASNKFRQQQQTAHSISTKQMPTNGADFQMSTPNTTLSHNGFNNVHHQQQQKVSSFNNRTVVPGMLMEQQLGQGQVGSSTTHQIKKHPPTAAVDVSEFDDANGLSNIALAFIFIVSLLTLIVIAASMIYKHKRRSMGRCAELPARSARRLTRNLTKRTKHFVRSNFVTPSDVTSVKSINLDTGSSITKSPVSSGGGGSGGGCLDEPDNQNRRTSADYITSSKKVFGQPLSTFNTTSTPMSEKYQFSSGQSEESGSDIKTLNTRLQKPSYLKSLISTPDCLLLGKTKQQTNRSSESSDGGAYYLNIRNRSTNLAGKFGIKSKSPTDEVCRLGGSGGNLTNINGGNNKKCESPKSCHSLKETNSRNVSCDKHPNNCSNNIRGKGLHMSTIHSVSDFELKTSTSNCGSSPGQLKKQSSNLACRVGKLNDLPAPRHLIASLPAVSSHSGFEDRIRPPDSTQIDKL